MRKKIPTDSIHTIKDWVRRTWTDGTIQYLLKSEWDSDPVDLDNTYIIERVNRPKSKMPNWCVVDRGRTSDERNELEFALYAPIVAGPFPNLKSAKAAYKLLIATQQGY